MEKTKQNFFKESFLEEKRFWDWALATVLLGITVVLFAPVTLLIAKQTWNHEQLTHSFLVLAIAGAALVIENRMKLSLVFSFEKRATIHFSVALILLGASIGLKSMGWFAVAYGFVFIAYCFAISAWVLFVFGDRIYRFSRALMMAFGLYVIFITFLTTFDWPLRSMAGKYSGWVLSHLGYGTQLLLLSMEEPKLILTVDGRNFEVAPECNGFGLISSSALLALLLAMYRKISLFDKGLSIVIALFCGSLFNTFRIVVICMLAPYVGSHYMLMHEIVGNLFFWGCLVLIWIGMKDYIAKPKNSETTNTK